MHKNTFILVILLALFMIFLSFNVVAANCWQYTTNSTCTADSTCKWKSDSWGSYCQELSCWSLNTQNECTTTSISGKNCTWEGGSTSYTCEQVSCYSYAGTNANSCENNSLGKSCSWSNSCYSVGSNANCWQNANQSACLNSTGCAWGQCWEKGCSSYTSSSTCNAAKDWNGKNCTWDSSTNYCNQNGCWKYTNETSCTGAQGLSCTWKWNSCQEVNCWNFDYTNQTACVNNTANVSCTWSGSYCNTDSCWTANSNSSCSAKQGCTWKAYTSSGWCSEVDCWTYDSWKGGNKTKCENNQYSLSCTWSGNPSSNQTNGWCYKDYSTTGCSNHTTERTCLDTYYCWWEYNNWANPSAGGTCKTPQWGNSTYSNSSILNDWNPECYIFDQNSTKCNLVLGCNYTNSVCNEKNDSYGTNISSTGIKCSYINDSGLCNGIASLSACCTWQNGTCSENKVSSACYSNLKLTPNGEDECEDAKSQSACNTISGDPWYMPCKWSNSTDKCTFNVNDVFGNSSHSLTKIENKKNCEAAGGKWITENYCEGNISVPFGRCEYKFDSEDNCDKACFACEIKDSNGNTVNSTNAEKSCTNSKLGFCEFEVNSRAPNGIGFCKAKEQFKKGIAGDCDESCGDCSYKGDPSNNDTKKRPSGYCSESKANSAGGGCKWINDNSTKTGGYCVNKGEKTCLDSCDRCKTQDDCSNLGRTDIANKSGSCKWQGSEKDGSCVANSGGDVEVCWDGVDNDNDNLIDCSDTGCYTDSYCGFVAGDCFGWTTNTTCIQNSCEWVTDKWGSWCDSKGSQCWKYDNNESTCGGISTVNELLNITTARLVASNINESKTFTLVNTGAGWVTGSVTIKNQSGTNIAGNFTVNYNSGTINFTNSTFMVSAGGSGNMTNVTYQYYSDKVKTNCEWNNGTGIGSCERDWTIAETCYSLNRTSCTGNCDWTDDTWCQSGGNSTDWCKNYGGWCDHQDFKSKNCWQYSANSTCSSTSGCSWKRDEWSKPYCDVNWTGNCWNYTSSGTCNGASTCTWRTDSWGSWCDTKASVCWSKYNQTACSSVTAANCNWKNYSGGGGTCEPSCYSKTSDSSCTSDSSGLCVWKAESGWCEETSNQICYNSTNNNNQANCAGSSGCRWNNPGWCSPKGGGFSGGSVSSAGGVGGAFGAECYKYDGNKTLCTNKTIINITCGWSPNANPSCEANWARDCWKYPSVDAGCNATNGCWFKNDTYGASCMNLADQCWSNTTLVNNATLCNQNAYCNATTYGCQPTCFSQASQSSCEGVANSACKWMTGWCVANGVNQVFDNITVGVPVPIGTDGCPESGMQGSVDICGFGMKDMGDAFGFGVKVYDFTNSSVCNKEKIGDAFSSQTVGAGNETVNLAVYLDTDGQTTGGCTLDNNSSANGYEFKLRYQSAWTNQSKSAETFTSYKCENSKWVLTDIKLSAWKKIMCSDIGGPIVAITKADLSKFPTLYDSTKDMRVYVSTIGNTGNVSYPTDTAGPGWTTPGSVDFEIKSAFEYGADVAKFEDILSKGFVKYEDCFNSIDDDNDGSADCNDWDCQYSSACSEKGVNTANYTDTKTAQVIGVKIEEYPDAALIMYDTNKPTNGTLEFYYNDSRCVTLNKTIADIGITSTNIRDYKLWHTAEVFSDNLGYALVNDSTYYYKLKVCDANNKCAISRCSSFITSPRSRCGFCSFVARIKVSSSWSVSYDIDQNGVYEHVQGEVCGPNAGLKSNYTEGRRANIKLTKSDGSTYFEFINASLTKTGLNDKVRTISASGDIISTSTLVGLTSETRDKIINNLHPEICRLKVPYSGTCDSLFHCDDNGENCTDRTSSATLLDASNCVWQISNCEFSTYREATTSGSSGGSSGSSGGSGGSGGATVKKPSNATSSTPSTGTGNVVSSDDETSETDTPTIEEEIPESSDKSKSLKVFWIILTSVIVLAIAGIYMALRYRARLRPPHHHMY